MVLLSSMGSLVRCPSRKHLTSLVYYGGLRIRVDCFFLAFSFTHVSGQEREVANEERRGGQPAASLRSLDFDSFFPSALCNGMRRQCNVMATLPAPAV